MDLFNILHNNGVLATLQTGGRPSDSGVQIHCWPRYVGFEGEVESKDTATYIPNGIGTRHGSTWALATTRDLRCDLLMNSNRTLLASGTTTLEHHIFARLDIIYSPTCVVLYYVASMYDSPQAVHRFRGSTTV